MRRWHAGMSAMHQCPAEAEKDGCFRAMGTGRDWNDAQRRIQ
jgi:hypothetical protein